ncbi:MAG: fatty acid desaturase family protein [Fimbriimonas sp.]
MAAVHERPASPNTIPNYRNAVKKALPPEVFKPDFLNLLWFPVHAAIIAGGWYLLATNFSWWLAPIVALVVGHTFGCMGFLAHDICHGGSIKRLWVRDLLSGISFSPFWIGPYLWRRWHNADHHNNTNIEGVDPDHLFTIEDYKDNPVLKFLYRISPLARNVIIFSSFTFRMSQQMLRMAITYLKSPKSTAKDKFTIVWQLLLPMAAWTALSLSFGTQVFWWGYVVPLLVANAMVISYIATNHFLNPLADERDVLATSLTVTLPKALAFLEPWHQGFGAHVAHHLFPQASARHGRIIEAKVAELFPDRYHSMPITRALKLLWNTPWIYEDKTTLIDPHREQRSKVLGHGMKNE